MNKQKAFLKTILLCAGLFLFGTVFVQSQNLVWAKRIGGNSLDNGASIATDDSGNSYVTGQFSGTATFGTGETNETILTSTESIDSYVAKYNNDGLLLWAKKVGGTENDQSDAIGIDISGNSFITGLFESSLTFGEGEANETTITSSGSRDIFIAKYNNDGMLLWAKRAGGSESNDHSFSISSDVSGNIYLTGFYNTSATFGEGEANETTLTNEGSFNIFVAKFNPDGLLIWVKQAGSASPDGSVNSSFDLGIGVAIESSGNCYVIGSFEDSAVFGEGEANETILTSEGKRDIFIAKYNTDGLLLWAKSSGSPETDEGISISTDASGNSYVTGHFQDSATFGGGEANEITLASSGSRDIYIAKYNPDGTLQWAEQAGGEDIDQAHDIFVDDFGNSYVTGALKSSAIFGAGEDNETNLNSNGDRDIFIAKYNTDGNLIWVRREGGSALDYGAGIGIDESGNSYVTGNFEGSATFGAGENNETILMSAGQSDIFIAKFEAGTPTNVDNNLILTNDFKLSQNYPNPFNPQTTINYTLQRSSKVQVGIYDMFGNEVRLLVNESKSRGEYSVVWDGLNNSGKKAASGHYIYQVTVDGFRSVKKMTLLK